MKYTMGWAAAIEKRLAALEKLRGLEGRVDGQVSKLAEFKIRERLGALEYGAQDGRRRLDALEEFREATKLALPATTVDLNERLAVLESAHPMLGTTLHGHAAPTREERTERAERVMSEDHEQAVQARKRAEQEEKWKIEYAEDRDAARMEAARWKERYYKLHKTFDQQVEDAEAMTEELAILRGEIKALKEVDRLRSLRHEQKEEE